MNRARSGWRPLPLVVPIASVVLVTSAGAAPPVARTTPTPSSVAPKAAVPPTPASVAPVPEGLKKPDLRMELVAAGPPGIFHLKVVNAGNAPTKIAAHILWTCVANPNPPPPEGLDFFPGCSAFNQGNPNYAPLHVVPLLAAGASHPVGGVWEPVNLKKKYTTLKAKVDPSNVIHESDETNNTLDLLKAP